VLDIPDSYLLGRTVKVLKELDDRAAIQALIESMEKHLYRSTFRNLLSSLNYVTGREDLEDTRVISERIEIIEYLKRWWQRNKDKSKPEWFADLLLNGRTEKTRLEALNTLQQKMADETIVPYIIKYFDSKNFSDAFYRGVFNLLARFGDDTCIPHIKRNERLLKDGQNGGSTTKQI